jgi:tetratricopeptide (TPR) repeat protein
MFDQIPARIWLLAAIGAAAYAPARYVFKYLTYIPTAGSLRPQGDAFSGRSPGRFSLYLALTVVLAALAVFIFTPAAEQFAHSPTFLPILMVAGGAWALSTVGWGLAIGRIQPITKGFGKIYQRETQPKRFWASLAWNAIVGCMCLWLAFKVNEQSSNDRCYNTRNTYSAQEEIAACNRSIADRKKTDGNLADLTEARGAAYYRIGDYLRALIDYNSAIRLGTKDSSSFYNRALVYENLGDYRRAVSDYDEAIRLQDGNADAHLNRGIILLNANKLDQSVADFTRVIELHPNDTEALANRGIAYAWKNDKARAERDFAIVRKADPLNPVPLRGEALLARDVGDIDLALERLNAALVLNPDDKWSLGMRAGVYRQFGEYGKSKQDLDKLQRLSGKVPTP